MTADEHNCEYRERVEELEAEVLGLRGQLAELQRHVFGQRSERMPTIAEEMRKERQRQGRPPDPAAAQKKRRQNRAAKDELIEERVEYGVREADKLCPKCGGTHFSKLGPGKTTSVYDYVPGHLIKRLYVLETLACSCGEHVVTAQAPAKVVEQGKYGPGFMTHIAMRKCADHNPVYRLEKDFKRLGVPVARSTMNDLLHRTAEIVRPVADRLLELIADAEIVFADETPVRIQAKKKCKRGYVWTFASHLDDAPDAPALVAYRFSPSRSGRTPAEVLGGSTGTLVVDAYTGYNRVTEPDARKRAGCLAHVRRKIFDALPSAPVAQRGLDLILDVYRIEHEAAEARIVGTARHEALRAERSRPAMDKLHAWLVEELKLHPPRSAMGKALSYALSNWERLTVFLDDARVPPDNNLSERLLRPFALGRKNWLFVGSPEAGNNLCALRSLISTCEANDVNPWEYIKDVLNRIGEHPARKLDELLPHLWQPRAA